MHQLPKGRRRLIENRDAFRTFVLGLLEHAEVLAPPELRDDLVEWLQALLAPSA